MNVKFWLILIYERAVYVKRIKLVEGGPHLKKWEQKKDIVVEFSVINTK